MVLGQSTSSDVLAAFGRPEYALLSQSKSIIALAGEKKKGYKTWFNMVVFDENELIARRKYVFISDERPRHLFVEPWEGAYFDCKIMLPKEVLEEPYANENARRIAILKQVESDVRSDTAEVGADNEVLAVSGMVVGRAIGTVLVDLEASPALASKLSDDKGLAFSHPSYKTARLQMVVEGDIATVSLRLGSFAKKLKLGIEREPQAD